MEVLDFLTLFFSIVSWPWIAHLRNRDLGIGSGLSFENVQDRKKLENGISGIHNLLGSDRRERLSLAWAGQHQRGAPISHSPQQLFQQHPLSDQPEFFYDSEKIILKVKAIVCEASVSLPAGTWYEAGQRHRIDKSRLAYIPSVSNIGSHLFFQVLAMCDPERRQHHHPRQLMMYIWHPVEMEQAH